MQASAARTKLVDKGDVYSDGVLDPSAGYETRAAYHSVVTVEYFPVDRLSITGSISTPATTNNLPGGSLAGLPNLGDDEFVLATVGATFYPLKGRIRPYVGGGLQHQFTTQERDGLAVGLDIAGTDGPYVNGGVKFGITSGLDIFADVRKAWYTTKAKGLLPLDATYTSFAAVEADAQLDPLTIQLGLGVRFGQSGDGPDRVAPRQAGDFVAKLGITNLELADEADLSVGGMPYEGASLSTFEHQTISGQLAYYFTPHIATNLTLGLPPKIDIFGAGTIGALPKLGEARYGPTALTVQLHPIAKGPVRPYAGVGFSYMIVFGADDGAFQDLKVGNDLGLAFELGVDLAVNDRWSLFLDAKKALLRPVATGKFNGADVIAQTRLDPWALSTGVALSF